MRSARALTAILPVLFLVAAGCIFEPREAESPDAGEEATWITPNLPKDVFVNLTTGLAADANSNYERSLSQDFTFVPLPEDVGALGAEVFEGWNKEIEMEFLTRLKGIFLGERTIQFGDENMVFDREDIDVPATGFAEFEGEYLMTLDPGDGSPVEHYAGRAIFYLEKQTQGWMLTKWEDIDVSGSYPTSGYLRGTLRGSN
ncbi:MAG TPA: hypothetical protein ENO08_06585 [Candidatus Eisenbacteria bacterium]|uniref:Nuclear transport factor 2 family protein n=1 Tax=Eiseniibacteriota bacterium TaxID=2212470 RepID=A0A7V2AVN5_UNCEI|nr:hypothetical protein [Candidatus Eisenbacteria bacterium]